MAPTSTRRGDCEKCAGHDTRPVQPLFYAALSFAAGIALAAGAPAALRTAALPVALLALAAALVPLLRGRRPRWLAAVALAGCLALGMARAQTAWRPPPPDALAAAVKALQTRRGRVWVAGYVRDDPQIVDGEARFDLEAQDIAATNPLTTGAAVWPAAGGVRLYSYSTRRDPSLGTFDSDDGASVPVDTEPSPAWPGSLSRLRAGDAIAVSVHLRPLAVPHDPGVFESNAEELREGIGWTATLDGGAWQPWPGGSAAPPWTVARARLWSWLSGRLDALAPPRRSARVNALLRGMLLGDTERLAAGDRQSLQVNGVYHLVVVAGLHVGILAVFLLFVFRLCRVPVATSELLTLLLLGLYAWVIVGRTPTLRALLMLAIYFGARRWYRPRQALNAVGAAALVLLWHAPGDLFAPGWQMSFTAATLLAGMAAPALAATSVPWRKALDRLDDADLDGALTPRQAQFRLDMRDLRARLASIWRPLAGLGSACVKVGLRCYELVLISAILQIGFAGFNAVYFHRVSPWAVVANVLLVPAAGLLIPLAWCALVLPAAVLGRLVNAAGMGLLRISGALAHWPAAQTRLPSPPQWYLCVFALALAAWLAAWTVARFRTRLWAAALPALALAVSMALVHFPARLPPGLSATILDVGQGDSIFVSFPDGRTLLVDAGPRSAHWDSGDRIVAPFLWGLGLRHIDAVLLTHGHNDHLGGMTTVVEDFHPTEVWLTRTLPTEQAVTAFLRAAIASGARLRFLESGQQFLAGPVRLQVLLPAPSYRSGEVASNDDSMTVRLSYGAQSMLLTGDTEAGGERWMLAQHLPLTSQLLKVGHHGSSTSSTPAFLQAVAPQVAVISDGAGNSYGHPAPDVVARLQADGARVYRTDLDGAVQCRLDGHWMTVYLFRSSPLGPP